MDEIGRVADRATVLRNGSVVAEFDARSMTATQASEAMVGRPLHRCLGPASTGRWSRWRNCCGWRTWWSFPGARAPAGAIRPGSAAVRRGEIVGLAGCSAPGAPSCWKRCSVSG